MSSLCTRLIVVDMYSYSLVSHGCVCSTLCTDFRSSGEEVEVVEIQEYVGDPAYGTAITQLHKIDIHVHCRFYIVYTEL